MVAVTSPASPVAALVEKVEACLAAGRSDAELLGGRNYAAGIWREWDAAFDALSSLAALASRTEELEKALLDLRTRAAKEPLGTDISDYSDEWCAGFLAGQVNALDDALAAVPGNTHDENCQVHQCQPPWRCTCGAAVPGNKETEA